MRKVKLASLTASLLAAAMLWGCGSSGSGGSDVPPGGTPDAGGVQTLGIDNCAVCHGSTPIAAEWLASRHGNSATAEDPRPAGPYEADSSCAPCHNQIGDGEKMPQAFNLSARNIVSCESCHGGGSAHRGVGLLPFAVPGPAQCGVCHGIDQALFHSTAAARLINDTHFDNPETAGIEGYVVDVNDERGCLKCHFNAHNPTLEINTAWANSGHAGKILQVKAAGLDAPVTDNTGPAWAHYDFKAENRASCQRCHTSTGAANFLNDPAGYDAAKNVFVATGEQREMLYCSGCHTGQSGAVRNPGALTLAGQTFPNAAASNVCVACHSGRESGNSIVSFSGDINNAGFINSHYLAAGGTLYGTIGYHFAGRSYASTNMHAGIGTSGSIAANAGTNGPCVSCHMADDSGNPDHSFEVVTHTGDQINAVKPTFCSSCHVGTLAFVADDLNLMKDDFHAGLEALKAQLAANGIHFANSYPYFFKSADNLTPANAFKAWGSKNTMGAAFNFNLLEHEPGGYAHNPRYAKRLIWDSIDWLDDGVLNSSTVAAVNALGLDASTTAAALAYLGPARP